VNTFLSSDQEALLARCRKFVAEHIAPIASKLDSGEYSVREIYSALGQEGLLGLSVAKEYGGQGAPFLSFILLCEAIAESEPGLVLSLAAHAQVVELLAKFGTDQQKSRYLPLLARGECIGTFALSEETAGSDYEAMKSAAVSKNGKFVLTGEKTWVVNGGVANLAVVVSQVKASEDAVSERLGLWLVDLEGKTNIESGANRKKLGLRSAPTSDVHIKGVELTAELELASGDSKEAILHALDISKVVVAASAVGLLGGALNHSVKRSRTREQFGSTIGKFQAIQWKLADMSTESMGGRLLTYRAAWSKDDAPEEFRKFSAMCKFYAARAARVHSSETVQIFGALGLSDDEPIEKLYRDAKAMEIAEGTSETQKNIVAKEVGV